MKAIRSLEIGISTLEHQMYKKYSTDEIEKKLET